MRSLLALATSGLVVLAGCADREAIGPDPTEVRFSTTTATAFTFLSPLPESASFSGELDTSLPVSVDICTTPAPCAAAAVVTTFSSSVEGSAAQRIGSSPSGYQVVWHTGSSSVSAGETYYIIVRVGAIVLGSTAVRLVRDQSARASGGITSVVHGQSLPIRFAIARGAVAGAAMIAAEGGTVAAGAVTLSFPAGAVDAETVVTVQPATAVPDPEARVIEGTTFDFGPDGTTFDEPVTIAIRYDPASIPPGVSPRLLRIHRLVDGAWQLVPGGTVDPATSTVRAQTQHFSTYGVLPAAFVQMTAGELHACGLTTAGEAWCWGNNGAGQLGPAPGASIELCLTTVPCSTTAVLVAGGHTFVAIEAGGAHTCGLTTDGQLLCWGDNSWGQLGNGTFASSAVPVPVSAPHAFVSFSAEFMQTCALTGAAELYCWGRGVNGALGVAAPELCVGTNPCSSLPLRVPVPPVTAVDVGLSHACAITTTSALYCWGWNIFGQVGTGGTSGSAPPTAVGGPAFASVSAGAVHTCGVTASGAGYCWGETFNVGALGTGTNTDQHSPAPVAGGLLFSQIDASNGNYIYTHSCGTTVPDARVYCWGANNDGQLGVAAAPASCVIQAGVPNDCALAPIPISSALAFTRTVTGRGYTCAATAGGDVYCWGSNSFGQLGDGTATGGYAPRRVLTAPVY